MKKFIMPLLAALVIGVTSTSCQKENFIESVNTVWTEFTVENWQWEVNPANDDLVCSLRWDVLSDYVLKCGNVQAYLYEVQNGITRQVPLPYVYPFEFSDPTTGNPVIYPQEIRFTIEKGAITFVVTDCGDLLVNQNVLPTMRFRAVCTYPVQYELPYEN